MSRSPPSKRIRLSDSPSPPARKSKIKPEPSIQLPTAKDASAEQAEEDNCAICLQSIVDRTVLPTCAHDAFCFECILIWTEQSRKCPLCTQSIGDHLIHNIRSAYDYQKHFIPPLPSISTSVTISSQQRRELQSRRTRRWGKKRNRERDVEDELERAVERRRWVYRHGLYAKHVASNTYTRYKPAPTPAQFAASPDLISRTTAFVRRELLVWPNLDVEFLLTFILSLMRSLDLRSEASIKLLAEFLDLNDGGRQNAEHFAHEVYSYLRSPYRALAIYDTIVQYDKPKATIIGSSPGPPQQRSKWSAPERRVDGVRSSSPKRPSIHELNPHETSPRDRRPPEARERRRSDVWDSWIADIKSPQREDHEHDHRERARQRSVDHDEKWENDRREHRRGHSVELRGPRETSSGEILGSSERSGKRRALSRSRSPDSRRGIPPVRTNGRNKVEANTRQQRSEADSRRERYLHLDKARNAREFPPHMQQSSRTRHLPSRSPSPSEERSAADSLGRPSGASSRRLVVQRVSGTHEGAHGEGVKDTATSVGARDMLRAPSAKRPDVNDSSGDDWGQPSKLRAVRSPSLPDTDAADAVVPVAGPSSNTLSNIASTPQLTEEPASNPPRSHPVRSTQGRRMAPLASIQAHILGGKQSSRSMNGARTELVPTVSVSNLAATVHSGELKIKSAAAREAADSTIVFSDEAASMEPKLRSHDPMSDATLSTSESAIATSKPDLGLRIRSAATDPLTTLRSDSKAADGGDISKTVDADASSGDQKIRRRPAPKIMAEARARLAKETALAVSKAAAREVHFEPHNADNRSAETSNSNPNGQSMGSLGQDVLSHPPNAPFPNGGVLSQESEIGKENHRPTPASAIQGSVRERLLAKLESERALHMKSDHGAHTDQPVTVSPAAEKQEARLRAQAHLRIKLAAEKRAILGRQPS